MTTTETITETIADVVALPADAGAWRCRLCFVTDQIVVTGELPADRLAAARQLEEWVAAGVTAVIDLRIESGDEEFVTGLYPEITYVHAPTVDDGEARSDDWFTTTVEQILAILNDPHAVVLIHCDTGVNLAPGLAMAVMLELGHSVTEALDAIHWARPIAGTPYAIDAVDWYHCRHGSDDFERYSDVWAAHCWIKKFQTN